MENIRKVRMRQMTYSVGVIGLLDESKHNLDRRLPVWARRTNPIVRRHLGVYWKAILPETEPMLRLLLFQLALLLLSFALPFILDFAMPFIIVSIFLLPVTIYYYGLLLWRVGKECSLLMIDERESNTLALLLTTPLPISHIIFSKVAAGFWRRVEDFGVLAMAAVFLSLPVIIMHYAAQWPIDEYPVFARVGMMLGLIVSLLRLILEPLMIGAMGVMIGAGAPDRISAVVGISALSFFYFALINLPRLLPMSLPLWIVIEIVLPIVLPLIFIWLSYLLARHLLRRD